MKCGLRERALNLTLDSEYKGRREGLKAIKKTDLTQDFERIVQMASDKIDEELERGWRK
jgi:hypothetical protein